MTIQLTCGTKNNGFERERYQQVVLTGRLQQIMFCNLCKHISDVFTHLCSNDYAHQNTQCVIRNASRSIMLLTTHKHDSEIINKSDPTNTCTKSGENHFPLHARCKGFIFRTNAPQHWPPYSICAASVNISQVSKYPSGLSKAGGQTVNPISTRGAYSAHYEPPRIFRHCDGPDP